MPGPPTPQERAHVEQWCEAALGGPAGRPPPSPRFSFRYAERPSTEFVADWQAEVSAESRGDEGRWTVRYRDPATGLEVRCEARCLPNFPAVDWVLCFRNSGAEDTPILEDVQPLDAAFALPRGQHCRVHHARGSDCRIDDFAPQVTPLSPDALHPQGGWVGEGNPLLVKTHGGRSSDCALPFFRLEMGDGPGVILGIGWTGDWAARFWRGESGDVRVQAGMQRTHLKLLPGEEIRTPRILLLFHEGDALRGHNLLRRLILEHYAPRRNGEVAQAPISFAVWGENRAERQLGKLSWFTENEIPIDNFWIDAGWHGDVAYKDGANVFNSEWGRHVGNWWPNATAYPDGLGPIGEAASAAGMDFTLWFEPERVFAGTQWTTEHPEWLLGPIGDNYLLNLGLPEAREGLTDLVSSVTESGKVTVYRQDFNTDPAPFWAGADAPDRVGISEIRHIEGLYAFWDALLERHPGLLIDNCSSGGRRIDLETLSRSIPLWRSDFQCFKDFDPIGLQGQTHGLSLWVPLHTGACERPDTYALRSALGPGIVFGAQPNDNGTPEGYLTPWEAYDPEWLREAASEQRDLRRYFAGDFYPLLSYSLADDVWAALQFDRTDLGAGLIIALRRPRSPFTEMVVRAQGLEADSLYEVTDRDTGESRKLSGSDLMGEGLTVRVAERPGSRLLVYTRADE